jgi:hypothetical protein
MSASQASRAGSPQGTPSEDPRLSLMTNARIVPGVFLLIGIR